jgi:hypothetical protein
MIVTPTLDVIVSNNLELVDLDNNPGHCLDYYSIKVEHGRYKAAMLRSLLCARTVCTLSRINRTLTLKRSKAATKLPCSLTFLVCVRLTTSQVHRTRAFSRLVKNLD